jgi:hypothetical protein
MSLFYDPKCIEYARIAHTYVETLNQNKSWSNSIRIPITPMVAEEEMGISI